ncbi:hypothetical protein LPJ75_004475 [Coemansia sp. RSA 2598]|nr:hypothetical protein LPJ75_004475 [Coemansia sp. RSA 2598]
MSQESLDIVRQLVAVVARTFYKDKYVIALDYLNRYEIARHDVLHKHLHMNPGEMHKVYWHLQKQKLVEKLTRREEIMENTRYPRQKLQTYYFLDYRQFVNVVKYRMWALQEAVKNKMQKEQDNLGYDCQGCSKHFTIMDVLSLVDPSAETFKCDYCGDFLIDNTESEIAQKSKRELSRFMEQFKTIIDLLQKTESIVLPPPRQLSDVPMASMGGDQGDHGGSKDKHGGGKELNVSRDTGLSSGNTVIEFAPDLSSKEAARLRESELAKKMRQNQLPAWHIWSTVSDVQMVEDSMITPEAGLRHAKFIERRNLQALRWNKREKMRTQAVIKELDAKLHQLADGRHTSDALQEEQIEAKREAYYQDFYKTMAKRVGIEMPSDPREHYQRLIDQIAKDEQLEKAEMEKRMQELERLEKERKEAAAAAAAQSADRGQGGHRYRGKFNPGYAKFNRSAYRHIRRTNHRLFEFVDSEQPDADADADVATPDAAAKSKGGSTSESKSDSKPEADAQPGVDADADAQAQAQADSDGHDPGKGADQTIPLLASQSSSATLGDDVPDPYMMGIYALPQSKRRKLGLDDAVVADLMDGDPESTVVAKSLDSLAGVDVVVCGKQKPVLEVTSDDEAAMTLDEYSRYWNILRSQSTSMG